MMTNNHGTALQIGTDSEGGSPDDGQAGVSTLLRRFKSWGKCQRSLLCETSGPKRVVNT